MGTNKPGIRTVKPRSKARAKAELRVVKSLPPVVKKLTYWQRFITWLGYGRV
jgi:hypothetical protein